MASAGFYWQGFYSTAFFALIDTLGTILVGILMLILLVHTIQVFFIEPKRFAKEDAIVRRNSAKLEFESKFRHGQKVQNMQDDKIGSKLAIGSATPTATTATPTRSRNPSLNNINLDKINIHMVSNLSNNMNINPNVNNASIQFNDNMRVKTLSHSNASSVNNIYSSINMSNLDRELAFRPDINIDHDHDNVNNINGDVNQIDIIDDNNDNHDNIENNDNNDTDNIKEIEIVNNPIIIDDDHDHGDDKRQSVVSLQFVQSKVLTHASYKDDNKIQSDQDNDCNAIATETKNDHYNHISKISKGNYNIAIDNNWNSSNSNNSKLVQRNSADKNSNYNQGDHDHDNRNHKHMYNDNCGNGSTPANLTTMSKKLVSRLEHSLKKEKYNKIMKIAIVNKLLFIFSLIFTIMYCSCAFSTLVAVIGFDIESLSCGDRATVLFLYGFQRSCLALYWVSRLYYSFRNTIYEMNDKLLNLFVACSLIGYNGGACFYVYTAYTTQITDTNGEYLKGFHCDFNQILRAFVICALFDVCWNIFLGILFIRKLYHVCNI